MRRRTEDIHVWPALTDLMCGIALVVVGLLVGSTEAMQRDRAAVKTEHARLEKAIRDAEEAARVARELARREADRIGVKRQLLVELRDRLKANHVQVEISPAGNLIIPADILFALDDANVDPRKVEPLGLGLRDLLLSENGANVRYVLVFGHTDDSGDPDMNLQLSLRRALNLVATWNQKLLGEDTAGPKALCATKKLIPSGMGQRSPAIVDGRQCGNKPGELVGCRANRRIEIQIVPKEADDEDPCGARPGHDPHKR